MPEQDIIKGYQKKYHGEFTLLRFPLTVLVVLEHAMGIRATVPAIAQDPLVDWMDRFINAFFVGQCVPVFFFISGYLFYRGVNLNVNDYKDKFKSRIKLLLVPYICWNLLALICAGMAIKFIPWMKSPDASTINWSFKAFFEIFWDNEYGMIPKSVPNSDYGFPIDSPLWYVKELMILTVFAPIIGYFIKKHSRPFLLIILVFWTICVMHFRSSCLYNHSLALFFFSWGGAMSFSKYYKRLTGKQTLFVSAAVYSAIGVAIISGVPYCNIFKEINLLIGTLFAISLSSWLISSKKVKINKILSSSSFFIYSGHFIILGAIFKIIARLVPLSSGFVFICEIIGAVIITVVVLLVVFLIGEKHIPKCEGTEKVIIFQVALKRD